ncbi:MAG: hypothetical protein IKB86_01555 [Clostridia bacterium]|nr:hypothetical protein [Clostridia bacterium]
MDQKYRAFNTHLIFIGGVSFGFLLAAVIFAIDKDIGIGSSVLPAIVSLSFAFWFIISPLYFVFSNEQLEIVYNFGIKERISWDKIMRISLGGSWSRKSYTLYELPHYQISYDPKEKLPFFCHGVIPKSDKTTKLIKKYYKKQIYKMKDLYW